MTMLPAYKRYRWILERKRRELVSYDCIQKIRAPDEIDNSSPAVDRETATAGLERRSVLMRQIADALTRIDHDEYGLCVRCGAEIAVMRLHSIPWTPHCIRCQEMAELDHRAPVKVWTGQQSATAALGE